MSNGASGKDRSRALDILIYLAERPGQVIGKKELIDNVWPDVIVEEATLRVHVSEAPPDHFLLAHVFTLAGAISMGTMARKLMRPQ